jgi:hypothetical protein
MTVKTKLSQLEKRLDEKLTIKVPPVPILYDIHKAMEKGLPTDNIPLNMGTDIHPEWEEEWKRRQGGNV